MREGLIVSVFVHGYMVWVWEVAYILSRHLSYVLGVS